MPRLLASVPQSVHVDLMSDRSQSIRDSVVDVEFTLLLTIGLVVMVIFIFLRHLWATIIPSITVPLSLVGTFGVMYVLGYSIDNLSLMGLTIAVGFVVDDAIVMIENIVRYIEEGEKPFDAALKGAGQIGFTIVSITFSLIAVFIPLLFMGGIVGRLFREFAVTVTVAVVMSAFVSLTLTPVMCARFPQAPDRPQARPARPDVRGRLRRRRAFLRPHPAMGAAPPAADAFVDDRPDLRHRLAVRHHPQGLLPRAGHRLHLRPGRSAPGHLLHRHGRSADPPGSDHPEGSRRVRRRGLRRLDRRQFGGEHRAHVHPAEAVRRARRLGPADHPAAAAQGRRECRG